LGDVLVATVLSSTIGVLVAAVLSDIREVRWAAVLRNTIEDCWVSVLRNARVGRVGGLGEGVRVSVVPWFGYRRGRR
jgi:uncharacterized membrane protein YccC